MTTDYEKVRSDIRGYSRELAKMEPDTMGAFFSMSKAALKDGALSEKVKEFIALAIGVSKQCEGCIAFHVKNLKDLGATREEVGEVLGMNVYMGGGPALMHAADALRAFDQLEAESEAK
ncbi:carboxymuconolactone decarboxylase family protein [Teredinibacter haidensis]|uniref:carboxymuconolactone decarboxylase family protein n=1 Tax=Teredinibacter haidensis TaxID=2731755 RepID=UPI000948C8BF|nr:carboxymuconolactone decarboxylase family protein [Teredinibacter haidensis]